MTYLEYKYRMEFNKEQYDEIDEYCKEKKDINWSASPWDVDSLNFLNEYDIPFIKIHFSNANESLSVKTKRRDR